MKRRPGSKTSPQFGTLPTSASTPNYMKSTISADARREQAHVRRDNHSSKNATNLLAGRTLMKRTASYKTERGPPEVLLRSLQVERVTCSSTLRGCKTPDYLKLSPGGTESEGTSDVKICRYSRCSLNGHVHALLPPLKSFISARQQALKTERNINLRCQLPKERPTRGSQNCAKLIGRDETATSKCGDVCHDFDSRENLEQKAVDASPQSSPQEAKNEFLEQPCTESMPNVNLHELDSQSSDMDGEKGKFYPSFDDYECNPKVEEESGAQAQGGKIITSAEFTQKSDDRSDRFFDEISADEVSQESFDEDSLNSDTLLTSDNCDSIGSCNYLENLCSKKRSELVPVPAPEAAPVGSQNSRTCSQNDKTTIWCNAMDQEEHNLEDEYFPNEDLTTEIANQTPQLLEEHAEEMTTLIDSATCKAIKLDQDHVENECNQAESFNGVSTASAAEYNGVQELNPSNMETLETEDKSSIQAMSNQEADEPTCFNPRELHLLALEPDPEAEKFNLRHQELDARKNAEEWMVDYALREAVTKIGPARERKVASLVEAFERVLPTSKS